MINEFVLPFVSSNMASPSCLPCLRGDSAPPPRSSTFHWQ